MRASKSILSVILILLIVLGSTVFAEEKATVEKKTGDTLIDELMGDLDYIDDIFKYDMYKFDARTEQKEQQEVITNKKAVYAVLSLGIMELTSNGKFSENSTVPYIEFAKIILKLSVGEEKSIAALYEAYGEKFPTTQEEAAKYLVAALGYQVKVNEDNYANNSVAMANKLGLFNGVTCNPKANITKGELAKMIFNMLKVDLLEQVTFGDKPTYNTTKGRTILSEKFSAIEITGVLNAVAGVNIYSTATPKKNRLEIDRMSYVTDNSDYSSMLAHHVFGYAKKNLQDEYEILVIMVDDKDQTLTIPMKDLTRVTEDKLYYMKNDEEISVSVCNVENVLYNGTAAYKYKFTSELIGGEGKIVLGESVKGGNYDVAVVVNSKSYWVERITNMDKKIYFKDGLTFDGLPYIDAEVSSNKKVSIEKDGKQISIDEIKPLNVISIIQSMDKSYIHIEVSEKFIDGTVSEMSENELVISDVTYMISREYLDAIKKANENKENKEPYKVHIFKIGDQGTYYLSATGLIAGYRGETDTMYGFMTKMDMDKGLNPQASVRLFSQDKEWLNLKIAKKMTLDGIKNLTSMQVYENLYKIQNTAFYEPVRYKLNTDGEVIFLDTVYENSVEKSDNARMAKSDEFTIKLDWTNGYNLQPTNYSITKKTVIFFLPGDLADEKEYNVINNTALISEKTVTLGLYNATEFFQIPVATYKGAVTKEYLGSMAYFVSGIKTVIDKDGAERRKLVGKKSVFVSAGVGSWENLNCL